VEHAALTGVHGRKAEGFACIVNVIDGFVGCITQGKSAGGFVTVDVEGDAIVIFGLEVEDLGGDVFKGPEYFTFAGDEKICVGTLAFDVDVAALEAVGIDCPGTRRDAVFEAETTGGGQQPH
jgi:hypothetical protein